jgi:uncharacterized protein with ParB-like and HNH nuclease domain
VAARSVRGSTHNLKDIFERYFYRIDYYQREYAWSDDDVRTLVTDLLEAFHQSWQDGGRPSHHSHPDQFFLGPFVYVDESKTVRFLVDGQQRFTTIHLIFMHLRRAAEDLRQKESEDKLGRVIGEFEGRRIKFRIDISERREALEAVYYGREFNQRYGAPISARNISARSDLIGEMIESGLTNDARPLFIEWLLNHVLLVGIKAGNRADGFKIFESMNDRGARLTTADLVKGFLISRATRYEEELSGHWRDMLARVTIDREDAYAPKEFLKTVLTARYARLGEGDRDADEIEASLNTWIRKNSASHLKLREPDDFYRFLDDILSLTEHYVRFMMAAKKPYFEHGLETLFYNYVNGIGNQLAAVMAAVTPREPDSAANSKAALVANYIDRLYVSRMLNDEPLASRDFDSLFRELIPKLRECRTPGDVAKALAPTLPTDSFEALWNFRRRGNNRRQVRYFLARLTAYVEIGCGKRDESESYLDGDKWHIEHLWPEHPEWYVSDYADPVEFRLARSRIGALTLLPGRDNESYKDLIFVEKAKHYGRQSNLTAILSPGHRLYNSVVNEFITKNGISGLFHDFGPSAPIPTVIESRTRLYQVLASRVWDPSRLGFPVPPQAEGPKTDPRTLVPPQPARKPRPTPNRRTDLSQAC